MCYSVISEIVTILSLYGINRTTPAVSAHNSKGIIFTSKVETYSFDPLFFTYMNKVQFNDSVVALFAISIDHG